MRGWTRCWALTLIVLGGCDDGRPTSLDASPGADAGPSDRDAGPPPPASPLVDPNCLDGRFSEPLPDPSASLADLEAAFGGTPPRAFIESVLGRRYGTGRLLVENGVHPGIGDCVQVFLRDSSSPTAIYGELSTIVHECGHFYDLAEGSGSRSVFVINDAPLRLSCSGGDTTSRGGQTFARSRIRDDEFQPLRPPGRGGDFYAEVYLDGDPDDATFQGGDQGFNSLLEETVQYVNSLATSYAFTNELNRGGASSQRDGILTFLWYLTRYLRMARLRFEPAYAHLVSGDGGCWRDAVLTVWGRAWLYLEVTRGMSHLGISDRELEMLATEPELLAEIQRLRDAAGCAAP